MFKSLPQIWHLLSLDGKKRLYWLILAVVIMALLDMVGVASIFPFLHVLSDPGIIKTSAKLNWAYTTFRFASQDAFLIGLGIFSLIVLILSNALRAKVSVDLIRFSFDKRTLLSKLLIEKYLYEPYVFFLDRNTSELTTYLVSEIARVVTGVLIPALQVFSRGLMAFFIVALLVLVDPFVAAVIVSVIGLGYIAIYGWVKKILMRVGTGLTEHSKKIYKSLHEAFGGIKDIKILGKEQIFIERFSGSVRDIGDCYCWQYMIFQLPRFAFEVVIFGGILACAVFIAVIQKNYQNVIPVLGLYAFAAYRLMPTLQMIYQDISNMRSSLPALDLVYKDFIACSGTQKQQSVAAGRPLVLNKEIAFDEVTFKYPNASVPVVENFDLTIKVNTTVGLVGGSGAGKTTLMDILLGLLRPQKGRLAVDGQAVGDENLRRWQSSIGYVPQHIYLCDDTVTHNIAFGIPDGDIDHQAVEKAARLANIHDFVVNELPNGYETEVGDRGVRLSGGQRQRIGIARALYHDPSLLVFDEATSALDGITEDAILEAIYNLTHKKTIIMIAHRLSTVKTCDVIYLLEKGHLIGQGTYDELLSNNRQFREMAKVGEHD